MLFVIFALLFSPDRINEILTQPGDGSFHGVWVQELYDEHTKQGVDWEEIHKDNQSWPK